MWFPIVGLIIGILLGSIFTVPVPIVYAKYLSIAVLAALDSLMGGVRGILEDSFDGTILYPVFYQYLAGRPFSLLGRSFGS